MASRGVASVWYGGRGVGVAGVLRCCGLPLLGRVQALLGRGRGDG